MAKKTRISKVYTKTGDMGKTMLVDGKIVFKDSERVIAYGDIDELNSILGIVLSTEINKRVRTILTRIQNDLFILGADLASTKDVNVPRIKNSKITWLENSIDIYVEDVGPL